MWVRAFLVPLSHDEVGTFFHFIHDGDFVPYVNALWDANNHLLNSLLTYGSYKLFGHSEIALRLPSLLIAPLYFYYHYKISQKLSSSLVKWVYIISMFFTHYLMEHLGYTRGYGMSLTFLAGAIFYVINYTEHRTGKNLAMSCLMLVLALSANLSLMHTFVIVIAYLLLTGIMNLKAMSRSVVFQHFIIYSFTALLFLAGVKYVLELKAQGALYMGGQEGFWEISVKTLIMSINFDYNLPIAIFMMGLFSISMMAFLWSNVKGISLQSLINNNNLYNYLLLGNIAAIILSNKIMGVNYPENRAVMFLIPYLIGGFCFSVNAMSPSAFKKVFVAGTVLLLFIPLRSLGFVNTTYQTYIDFIEQRIPQRYISTIIEDGQQNGYKPLVSGYHMRHFVYAYYNFKNGGQLNHFYEHDYPGQIADYQIVDTSESQIFTRQYDLVDFDPITNYSLIKRKERIKTTPLFLQEFEGTKGATNQEYYEFYRNDSLGNDMLDKAVSLKFNYHFKSPHHPIKARLVIAISDVDGNGIFYDYFPLDWTKTAWDDPFDYEMYVHHIPKEAQSMVVYIWNINKKEFEVSEGTVKFEEILLDQ